MKAATSLRKNAILLLTGLFLGASAALILSSWGRESRADMYEIGHVIAQNKASFALYLHYRSTGSTNVADILKGNVDDFGDFSYNLIDLIDKETQLKEKKIDPHKSETWSRYDPAEKDRLILKAVADGNDATLMSVLNLHRRVLRGADKQYFPAMDLSNVNPKFVPSVLMYVHLESRSNLRKETLDALKRCKAKLEKISEKKTWIEMSRQQGSCSKIMQSSLYAELEKVVDDGQ